MTTSPNILTAAPELDMTGVDVVLTANEGDLLIAGTTSCFAPFVVGRIVDTLVDDFGPLVDVIHRGETIRTRLSATLVAYRLRVA